MALTQQGKLTDEQIAQREAARIARDKKENEERRAAEKAAIDAQNEKDAKRIQKEKDDAIKAENAVLKRQIKEREDHLATPLTDEEVERLAHLEKIANSGRTVDTTLMRELADLRVRSKAEKPKKSKK